MTIFHISGLGYKDEEVGILAHKPVKCSENPSIPGELNYPSFSVKLGPSQTYTRTVTNVGEANSSYEVIIIAPKGVDVIVKPTKLYFSELNQKATYSITFTRVESDYRIGEFTQGYIKWVSANYYFVRSPIAVRFE
ncbi:Peptidase S8, subtilisin-related protein [Corchorus capsularis]|uniref:Peptidase S8, subtilisin-related protein n=1 Tax=Corchorus capsularis TaxID=210143 RepID=A0A1R3J4D8_COCAP|nr:Peptidase S8, subtilisin-related protein [Corchorus capsularis]